MTKALYVAWAVAAALSVHGAAAQPSSTIPVADPDLALAAVRDAVPDGAPAQKEPYPLPRRKLPSECGAPPSGAPHNLLRWAFDRDLGFPSGGFDLYRCCGPEAPPEPGDPEWVKLNQERIRPPRSASEGQVFVSGSGALPDQGRQVIAPRLTAEEWASYCDLLQSVTLQPSSCPPLPDPPPQDPEDTTIDIGEDPMATLLLASLRPEIATLLGLYWVDDNGDREDCYYRLEGFWDDRMLTSVTGPVTPATLAPPTGLELAQTPSEDGTTCAQLGGPEVRPPSPSDPAIQLRWDLPDPVLWTPPAETAITYNVCRQGPDDSAFERINVRQYDDPTQGSVPVESPVLVPRLPVFDAGGKPVLAASGQPETKAPDVFYEDRLASPQHDGTYNYRITGMDVFGRESAPSTPASRKWVDTQRPPAVINLLAETELNPPSVPATSEVTLTFDWTQQQRERAPDAESFVVYRRIDTPDLKVDGEDCPIPLATASEWKAVGSPIPVGPPESYQLVDTLTLPDGPPVRHFYYRVVAIDAAKNAGGPSGPARGHVVDNNPATPPSTHRVVFSQSEWDDTVQVHLLWPATGEIMGYKLLRSASAPRCTVDDDCPSECNDSDVCVAISCDSGFCGGPDSGPSHPRGQEDREANLTHGVDPYNPGDVLRQLPKLRSLAELGNLWDYGEYGMPVAVAPGCRLPDPSPTCEGDLKAALGPEMTQYRQDNLPRKATEPTYFYRVMAVSRAGIQETEDGPSTLSPAFPVRIPDFVLPAAPVLASVLAHLRDPDDPDDVDAVEITWSVGPERDAHTAEKDRDPGYTVWRADVGGETTAPPALVANSGSYTPGGLDPGSCYRFDVRVEGGPLLASALMLGEAPREITWTPPPGVAEVAVEERGEKLEAVNGQLLLPMADTEPIDGLRVHTDNFGAPIPTLRVWDQPPEAEHDYCYAVGLMDLAGNDSELSRPLIGRRLDTTPPAPPAGLSVARVAGEARLRWSHTEEGLRATVKRSVEPAGPWRTLTAKASPRTVSGPSTVDGVFDTWLVNGTSEYRFRDLKAAAGRAYHYRVELYDAAGNKSGRDDGKIELEEDG